jgi:hypothetical protein
MVGVTTTGGTPLAFTDLQVVVNGDTLELWSVQRPDRCVGFLRPISPLGRLQPRCSYQAANPSGSFGRYQSVDVSFDAPGFGGFSSEPGSPNSITLQSVNSFQIRATLAGLSKPSAANIVRFDVGPAGVVPADTVLMQESGQGSGFGGYFSTQVPGPLPLGAAAAAVAWSRRLRQKQRAGQGIPPTHAAPRP